MSEQGNDEAGRRTPPEIPAYGTPDGQPIYGTPQQPPSYGTPPDPGTAPFEPVPPTAAYGSGAYPGGPPYTAQAYTGQWRAYPEPSQAVLALVLGIIGLFVFWPIAPVAWVVGRKEVQAVDAGRRDPVNRGVAQAGQIMGIIGTVLLAFCAGLVVIFAIAFVSFAGAGGL